MEIMKVLEKLENNFNGAHGRTPWRRLRRFMEGVKGDPLDDVWTIKCNSYDEQIGSSIVCLTLDRDGGNFNLEWDTCSDHYVKFNFLYQEYRYILDTIIIGDDESETFYLVIRELFYGEKIKEDKS